MTVEWINRDERVPDSRRTVLTWGRKSPFVLLGGGYALTKYNADGQGSGSFDAERTSMAFHVTHWAELQSPEPNK